MNGLGEIVFEHLHGCERGMYKAMLATSFHQLGDAAIPIDVHDNEQAGLPGHTDNFP
ncbi:MAG: hypothetical protein WBX19_13045 [Terracidiphilus sp.]